MNLGKTIFAQLIKFLPIYEFRQCIKRYQGTYKVQTFSCWDQFLCMAFAQLTYRESLRDIEVCLRARQEKLYHMGIRSPISRNTLAYTNENRDWRIYADFAHVLIQEARSLYVNDSFGVELEQAIYALDSTTIDLCLSLFPWAQFRKRKGAVKLHTLMDLKGNIPTLIIITDGKIHDVNILDELLFRSRSHLHLGSRLSGFWSSLYASIKSLAFFITRAKSNFDYQRLYSQPVDKTTGVQCDQIITLQGFLRSAKIIPKNCVGFAMSISQTNKRFVFLTNNFISASV